MGSDRETENCATNLRLFNASIYKALTGKTEKGPSNHRLLTGSKHKVHVQWGGGAAKVQSGDHRFGPRNRNWCKKELTFERSEISCSVFVDDKLDPNPPWRTLDPNKLYFREGPKGTIQLYSCTQCNSETYLRFDPLLSPATTSVPLRLRPRRVSISVADSVLVFL